MMETITIFWQNYWPIFYSWCDILWLPALLFVVHKPQRLLAAGYVVFCMIMLRLEVGFINEMGFTNGLTGFITMQAFSRGLIVFSIGSLIFGGLSYVSPRTKGSIYLAASITVFFTSSLISFIVMFI